MTEADDIDTPETDEEDDENRDVAGMTFEAALKELEEIVAKLEHGDVALEESIVIYERGEALKAHCDRLLRAAEQKVEKIRLAADGTPRGVEPLDFE